MAQLLEPFSYEYMVNAMWVSALVGAVCAFLSAYLMLKGWSLIGDALSHAIVPGVAGAYILGLPFSVGAFISGVSLAILLVKWKDLLVTFFDENHARSVSLNPTALKVLFFTLLSACTVAALQTVGAFLVIAMVVTPGATAYLLTDRFPRLILVSVAVGALSSGIGAYLSYFLDGATGGIIIVLQTLVFLAAFFLAPKHGLLAARRRMRAASGASP